MKKKQPEHFEIPNHYLKNFLLGICGIAIIAGLAFATPWADLQTSIIDSPSVETEVVNELKKMNQALAAIQQKDTSIKNVHEYLLTKDVVGTTEFMINSNTCANGARIIIRLRDEFRGTTKNQSGAVNIQGVSMAKGRTIYSATITVDETMPAKMRNMPSQMILDEETVFPDYKISSAKNAERVEYKVECY